MLRENLEPLLRENLTKEHKFKFWCEARLGRLVSSEKKRFDLIRLGDVCEPSCKKEFYTR